MKNVSEFLRNARSVRGHEAKGLAKKLKYTSPQSIYDWENGTKPLPLKKIPHVAKVYGVSRSVLIGLWKRDMITKIEARARRANAAKV